MPACLRSIHRTAVHKFCKCLACPAKCVNSVVEDELLENVNCSQYIKMREMALSRQSYIIKFSFE